MSDHPLLDALQTVVAEESRNLRAGIVNRGPHVALAILGVAVTDTFREIEDAETRMRAFDTWVKLTRALIEKRS